MQIILSQTLSTLIGFDFSSYIIDNMWEHIISIIVAGWAVLIVAILLNIGAKAIKIKTWYEFISGERELNVVTFLWLFVLYPIALGLAAYLSLKLIDW